MAKETGLTLLSHSKKARDASHTYYYALNFSWSKTPYNKKCAPLWLFLRKYNTQDCEGFGKKSNRTYVKKPYNLDDIVGAYRRLPQAMPFAPTLRTICVSPVKVCGWG